MGSPFPAIPISTLSLIPWKAPTNLFESTPIPITREKFDELEKQVDLIIDAANERDHEVGFIGLYYNTVH
jgi:hypothetical protein